MFQSPIFLLSYVHVLYTSFFSCASRKEKKIKDLEGIFVQKTSFHATLLAYTYY